MRPILNDLLKVCEIFKSIQGESTFAGRICSFVRLTGCNLACTYCDTKYAFTEGSEQTIDQIFQTIRGHRTSLIEITGGEPLLQNNTPALCKKFIDNGYTVLVETNGSVDIGLLPAGCIRIVDVKCPGSGSAGSFQIDNIEKLTKADELKFVISDKADFDWSFDFVVKHELNNRAIVLFSPCMGKLSLSDLAAWIIESNAAVRYGLQLHKIIWGDQRGV